MVLTLIHGRGGFVFQNRNFSLCLAEFSPIGVKGRRKF